MFCQRCGKQYPDDSSFCPACGTPNACRPTAAPQPQVQPQPTPQVIVTPQPQTNSYAIAGFVLSLIGIAFGSIFILQLLGFLFSILGLSKVKACGGNGKGFAIAGLIISLIDVILGILLLSFFLTLLGFLGGLTGAMTPIL